MLVIHENGIFDDDEDCIASYRIETDTKVNPTYTLILF